MSVSLLDDALAAVPRALLIGGQWCETETTFAVHDPSTGAPLAWMPDAGPAEALAALDAADEAQRGWAATAPRERAEVLRRAFEALHDRREEIAVVIAAEMGKPLEQARGEVDYGAEYLRWFSEEAVRHGGEYRLAPDGRSRLLVTRRAIGPCLLITPWNFPLAMATRKVAAALAAGCTAILKPAAETPLTAAAFAALMTDVGLPGGVLNLLTTTDAAGLCAPLLADGRVRKLSFTGSTEVGRRLIAQCGEQVIRPSMELGGNAPFIVLEDADLDRALDGAMLAKLRNMGQACTAANRFLVEAPIASAFARGLAERMGTLRLGGWLDPEAEVGPLIDAAAQARLGELVADATERGATVLCGGSAPERDGWFFAPTVLEDVDPGARAFREEIFGPLAAITPLADADEAVVLANRTEHGLVAYVYTRDIERALQIADRLETGMVALNRGLVSNAAAPFGGVKQSGLGREGGREGIDDYLDIQYVCVDA